MHSLLRGVRVSGIRKRPKDGESKNKPEKKALIVSPTPSTTRSLLPSFTSSSSLSSSPVPLNGITTSTQSVPRQAGAASSSSSRTSVSTIAASSTTSKTSFPIISSSESSSSSLRARNLKYSKPRPALTQPEAAATSHPIRAESESARPDHHAAGGVVPAPVLATAELRRPIANLGVKLKTRTVKMPPSAEPGAVQQGHQSQTEQPQPHANSVDQSEPPSRAAGSERSDSAPSAAPGLISKPRSTGGGGESVTGASRPRKIRMRALGDFTETKSRLGRVSGSLSVTGGGSEDGTGKGEGIGGRTGHKESPRRPLSPAESDRDACSVSQAGINATETTPDAALPQRTEYARRRLREHKAKPDVEEDDEESGPLSLIECEWYSSPAAQPFAMHVYSNVLFMMDVHAHLADTEVIGLLGGSWDARHKVLQVQAAFTCRTSDISGVNVELDPVSEVTARAEIAERKMEVVGWYHSHPIFTNLPSVTDIENHTNYQLLFEAADRPFIGAIITPYCETSQQVVSSTRWWFTRPGKRYMTREIPFDLWTTVRQSDCVPAELLDRSLAVVDEYGQFETRTDFSLPFGSAPRSKCSSLSSSSPSSASLSTMTSSSSPCEATQSSSDSLTLESSSSSCAQPSQLGPAAALVSPSSSSSSRPISALRAATMRRRARTQLNAAQQPVSVTAVDTHSHTVSQSQRSTLQRMTRLDKFRLSLLAHVPHLLSMARRAKEPEEERLGADSDIAGIAGAPSVPSSSSSSSSSSCLSVAERERESESKSLASSVSLLSPPAATAGNKPSESDAHADALLAQSVTARLGVAKCEEVLTRVMCAEPLSVTSLRVVADVIARVKLWPAPVAVSASQADSDDDDDDDDAHDEEEESAGEEKEESIEPQADSIMEETHALPTAAKKKGKNAKLPNVTETRAAEAARCRYPKLKLQADSELKRPPSVEAEASTAARSADGGVQMAVATKKDSHHQPQLEGAAPHKLDVVTTGSAASLSVAVPVSGAGRGHDSDSEATQSDPDLQL